MRVWRIGRIVVLQHADTVLEPSDESASMSCHARHKKQVMTSDKSRADEELRWVVDPYGASVIMGQGFACTMQLLLQDPWPS